MINTGNIDIENISIFSSWAGAGSIGILMRGREFTTISGASIFADKPIVIEPNPSIPEGFIDCDHLHMQDLYLGPQEADGVCIYIAEEVELTNFVMDGTNSFVMAKYGVYWNDTITPVNSSNNFSLKNVRMEQSTGTGGYAVYMSHNVALQNVLLENISADYTNGFYFRHCHWVTLLNCVFPHTSGYSVNTDNTCSNFSVINCLWQVGSTESLPAN
ncbi:MAG: hypothetical protein ABIJ86_12260 [Spirochaetota bacterium]